MDGVGEVGVDVRDALERFGNFDLSEDSPIEFEEIVPAGTFLTGSIRLRSNVELHLDQGATLLGSRKRKDYKKPVVERPAPGARLLYRSKASHPWEDVTAGTEPAGNLPEEYAASIKADIAKWAQVIKAAGIKAE